MAQSFYTYLHPYSLIFTPLQDMSREDIFEIFVLRERYDFNN